jgi:hypothetical protein
MWRWASKSRPITPQKSPRTVLATRPTKNVSIQLFLGTAHVNSLAHSLELLWEWGRWGVERIEAFPLAPSYLNFQCNEVAVAQTEKRTPKSRALAGSNCHGAWIRELLVDWCSCGGPFQRRTRKKEEEEEGNRYVRPMAPHTRAVG